MTDKEKRDAAREMLQDLKYIEYEVIALKTQINELLQVERPNGYPTSTLGSGEGGGSAKKPTIGMLSKLKTLREKLDKRSADLLDYKDNVMDKIDKIGNQMHRIILFEKYVNGKTLPDIALQMRQSVETVRKAHKDALIDFYDVCHENS